MRKNKLQFLIKVDFSEIKKSIEIDFRKIYSNQSELVLKVAKIGHFGRNIKYK